MNSLRGNPFLKLPERVFRKTSYLLDKQIFEYAFIFADFEMTLADEIQRRATSDKGHFFSENQIIFYQE
jgi:hypothetical protein